jgi:hypothetical protein
MNLDMMSSSRPLRRILENHSSTASGGCKHKSSHNTHLHIAAIVKRGKILATAENRLGSRSKGAGYSHQTIHAERAVVKKLGDISQLRGAILCVWRISLVHILPSKPCPECQVFLEKCMREYGLRAVHYTDTCLPL